MAEFQLVVPYQPLQARLQFLAVCAMLPIWSFIAPGLLSVFAILVALNPGSILPLYTAVIILALLSVTLGGAVLSALSEDNKIHVSKHGVSFPPFLVPRLRFRRNWLWSELTTATVLTGDGKNKKLLLGLGSSTLLSLNMNNIDAVKLEELLLAIELWATGCQRSPELIAFQNGVQNVNKGLEQSHTKMWQEELVCRFTATTFLPLEPGRTLRAGQVKVIRQLAFGGLSAIYLVQKGEADFYILKEAVVPPSADPEAKSLAEQHLTREAKMLSYLRHANIAQVLDHFVEDNRHYLLMEYHLGQDLRQYVQQIGPCNEKQVRDWAIKIAEILEFLHEQDPPVIHRDLTPDNLVLKNNGTLMLIDFGASNEFVGTATGTLIGKQAYIAPEQLRGKAVPQSDLYAMGGTLYFLLTGRDPMPLSQSNVRDVLADISPPMEQLIKSLTAFDTKDRIASASALTEYLKQLWPSADPVETGGASR